MEGKNIGIKMKKKGGADFIKLLSEIGYSRLNGLQGEDFDWLWETSAQPLMDWLCQKITKPDNVLTDVETYQWRKFPKERVLKGKNLEEALENATDTATAENDSHSIGELREELDVRQTNLSDLEKVKLNISNANGRLSFTLHSLEQTLGATISSLAEEQKKLLRLNSELNDSLNKHQARIRASDSELQECVIDIDLCVLFRENDGVLSSLKSVIDKQLNIKPLREFEEFEMLASEIHRLRVSISEQEQKRVLHEAKGQGKEAGLELLKGCLKTRNMLTIRNDLSNEALEEGIRNAQLELRSLIMNLCQAADQNVARKCSEILADDLKAKTTRQKYILDQMNVVTDLLLNLASIQEALGSIISRELHGFESLEKIFKDGCQIQGQEQSQQEAHSSAHTSLQAKQELIQRNTLVPWDNGLRHLHKLLTRKELDPSMVTYDDLQHLLQTLDREKQGLEMQLSTQIKKWKSIREEVRSMLKSIMVEINVKETSKHFDLSPYDATIAIKNAQKEVGQLEQNVKEALNEWDRACKLLKENPILCLEKKVWKEFSMDAGAKMESSINAMRRMAWAKGKK